MSEKVIQRVLEKKKQRVHENMKKESAKGRSETRTNHGRGGVSGGAEVVNLTGHSVQVVNLTGHGVQAV